MKRLTPASPGMLFVGACASALGLASAQAANYYLHQDQASGWNWHTTAAGNTNSWYNAPTGGSIITSMDAGGTYYTNTFQVRTPSVSTSAVFSGAKLVIDNGGDLSLKMTTSSAVATVPYLVTQGSASILAANANSQYHSLTATVWDQSDTTTFTAVATRSFRLNVGDLNGSGTIVFAGGATSSIFELSFANSSDFTGALSLTGGTLALGTDLTIGGSLSVASGSLVQLSKSISVSALSIGGVSLADGTYSYASLNSAYDAYFADGAYTGQIIVASAVPEPSSFAAFAGLGVLGAGLSRRRRRG